MTVTDRAPAPGPPALPDRLATAQPALVSVTTPIDRAGPADLTVLAADRPGGAPEQIGVVLVLDAGPPDAEHVHRVLVERIASVPRLRQRLRRLPPGLGRAMWVDDAGFDPARHLHRVRLPGPLDDDALLEIAAGAAGRRLPRSAPLWAATLVTGSTTDRIALVLVLHHAIADGIGGLAVLDRLLDGDHPAPPPGFPRPRPAAVRLAADAARGLVRVLPGVVRAARELPVVAAAGGGLHSPPVTPCSLLAPTGPRRRLAVARTDLAPLRAFAHRHGGTVNDVLLGAAAGALRTLLADRGESIGTIRIAVVVGGQAHRSTDRPGNVTAPIVVGVPADRPAAERVRCVTGQVRAARTGPLQHGPVTVLQGLYRLVASLGLYRTYRLHQRRMHTMLSNLRGPDRALRLAGRSVRELIPLSSGEAGNLTVQFVALSHAGRLVVTTITDPDRVPDLDRLVRALHDELDALGAGRTALDRRTEVPGPGTGADRPSGHAQLLGSRRDDHPRADRTPDHADQGGGPGTERAPDRCAPGARRR